MMTVVSQRGKAVRFDSVPEGTPFVDDDGDFAVKSTHEDYNAVVFETGAVPFAFDYDDDALVTPTPFTVQFTLETNE